ncbi:HRDC domain-containing protein [Allobaculum sp. Allo2]|nr:HRDC domain-containing protein [Allobaculum sp. Allo2]UNT93937.1 HRDC domain-containing protein [Allobaculum sp. Allo2]
MRRPKRHSLPEGSRTGTNRSASRSALSNTSRSIASSLSSPGDSADAFDTALFDRLRQKRLDLAKARGLPPYIIFSDATLMAMAREMPLSEDEFMAINGVGQIKFERYGKAFLGVIQDFLSKDAGETGTDTDN